MPKNIGIQQNGMLAPCPSSPNCVCSCEDAGDAEHYIAPVPFTGPPEQALVQFRQIITSMKRTKIKTESEYYLHATFTSAIWRFVDDVEVLVDPEAGVVHLRSASRLGKSDLGANRKRVEKMIRAFK